MQLELSVPLAALLLDQHSQSVQDLSVKYPAQKLFYAQTENQMLGLDP